MKDMFIIIDGTRYDFAANSTWTKINVLDPVTHARIAVIPVDVQWSEDKIRGLVLETTKSILSKNKN